MGKINNQLAVITWQPYPEVRPSKTGSYLVCYESGGINFGYYNRNDEDPADGAFSQYHRKIIAWATKPKPYVKEMHNEKNNAEDNNLADR